MTASLLEQLADLPKAEGDALIRAMAPGEAPRVARWCGPNRWRRSTMRSVAPTMSPPLLTNRNLLKPCPSPARWSGSRRRRTKANHGGFRAEMCMHDRDNLSIPLGGDARGKLQGWICTRPALVRRGTEGSNPSPSSGESANFRFRETDDHGPAAA